MTTKNEPLTDNLEEKAKAIGKRLMELHPFMQIKQVEVIDGVVLVERVGLGSYPCTQDSKS